MFNLSIQNNSCQNGRVRLEGTGSGYYFSQVYLVTYLMVMGAFQILILKQFMTFAEYKGWIIRCLKIIFFGLLICIGCYFIGSDMLIYRKPKIIFSDIVLQLKCDIMVFLTGRSSSLTQSNF